MSLEQFCSDKGMIVQDSRSTAFQAARALASSHVGAVIVEDQGRVVGIVTDRDLAVRVLAADLDAKRTPLSDVMSGGPVTVSIDDSQEHAIKLMLARHVRRIPILDGARAAGIVTLDDLLMAGAIDPASAGEIVEVQLTEPSATKPAGVAHPLRPARRTS